MLFFCVFYFTLATLPQISYAQERTPSLIERLFGDKEEETPQKTEEELFQESLPQLETDPMQERPYKDISEVPQEALDDMQGFL